MISICIIAKDEEAVLDRCLSSLVPYECEIVFVDTGSTDRTKEIALTYTDKVYDFTWEDDFSAARNFAISKASNDYILTIDCDEVITWFDKDKTEQLIQKYPDMVGRLLRVNEFMRQEDEFGMSEAVDRLFSKKLFKYEGAIQERIVSIDGSRPGHYSFPLSMTHSGYDGNMITRKDRTVRNREMLLKEYEKNKKDDYVLYQLGKTYYAEADYENALVYFGKMMKLDVDPNLEYVQNGVEAYGYCLVNTDQNSKALDLLKVYNSYSELADFVYLMGIIYMNNGLDDRAIAEFRKATTLENAKAKGVNSFRAYYNIGLIHERAGNIEEAKKFYKLSSNFVAAFNRLKELEGK